MARVLRLTLLLLGLVALTCAAAGENNALIVRHLAMPEGDTRDQYHIDLLAAVLKATAADYGPGATQAVATTTVQQRALKLLENGEIDLFWGMTSVEREVEALPVRFPLMAGLLGYRVLLVRPDEDKVFARVRSLRDLAGLRGVQGHDWPDTRILRGNGLQIEAESDYPTMFRLVENRLVDYFPRSLVEAYAEQQRLGHNLAVDRHLLLVYPTADYFFVAKNNQALADRLALGLRRLQASGAFDDLLFGTPTHRLALSQAALTERHILHLQNPDMPPSLPLADGSLWFSIERYQRWLARQPASP